MKLPSLLSAVMMLAIGLSGQTGGMRLEGCPDPTVIAKALAEIAQMRWHDLSRERVREIWPTELSNYFDPHLRIDLAKSCATVATCLTDIWSDGRVIGGQRQCGEKFGFATDRKQDGSTTEGLRAIEISYSARTRKEVVEVARTLGRAVGLPDVKTATIGRDPKDDRAQEFQWDTASKRDFGSIELNKELSEGKVLELSWLIVSIFRRERVWSLGFQWTRNPIDPPERKPRAP